VALSLSVSNSECTVSPVSIVLDTANWSEGAIVSVTAVDDDLNDGQQSCVVQTALTSSADPDYDGLDAEDVIVVVYDDDIIHRVCLPSIANRWSVMPDIPTLSPADNGDGDGTYSIGWSATDHAETYVLEEATDGGFFGASVIYSGPDTSYTVTGRGAARYYYRVKGRTAWSDSGWSNARTVDVLWEKEPNDQALDQANGPIISTLNYYGTFPSQYDVSDYFFFDLSASHPVRIRLTHIADGLNYDLVLRDASLAIRGYSAQLSNHNEEIRTSILPAGRYYIQVFHRPGEGSTQPYHLNYALE
jgi:hypothetical protein